MQHKSIAFIGAGNMTRSIIGGVVASGYPATSIIASNRSEVKLTALAQQYGVHTTLDNAKAIAQAEVVVLAVKPQMMEAVCQQFPAELLFGKVFISIAAGLTVARLQQMLGGNYPIIRTMPNTPSAIGQGMTGLYAAKNVSKADCEFAGTLMSAIGEILWLQREDDIDGVIAAAGSSPAYFFYILEAMQEVTEGLGFEQADARLLVQQALLGSAQLVVANPELSLAELRQQVTSKGGATAEAIAVFEQQQLPEQLKKAMHAAIKRSQQLSTAL